MDAQTALPSTQTTANSLAVSVKARSTSDLTRAIHSQADDEFTLNRARICLKMFYDPDMSEEDRLEVIGRFAKALTAYPKWAVAKAFNDWERTGKRRPAPADIGELAAAAIKVLTDELAARRKAEEAQADDARELPDRDAVKAIMEELGFTPRRMEAVRAAPMAASVSEAESRSYQQRTPHWSEVAPPDSPAWDQLRAARAANPLMQAAREDAARHEDAA